MSKNTELEDTILDRILTELESRGILIDDWQEVFGCQSFDEVAEIIRNTLVEGRGKMKMITTLQNTICTAILWLALALVAGYLYSHSADLGNPLKQRMADAANVR